MKLATCKCQTRHRDRVIERTYIDEWKAIFASLVRFDSSLGERRSDGCDMRLFVMSDIFDIRVVFGGISSFYELLFRQCSQSLLVKDILEMLKLRSWSAMLSVLNQVDVR
jgi:hypothetical protein